MPASHFNPRGSASSGNGIAEVAAAVAAACFLNLSTAVGSSEAVPEPSAGSGLSLAESVAAAGGMMSGEEAEAARKVSAYITAGALWGGGGGSLQGISNLQPPTSNLQPPTSNLQPSISKFHPQPPTPNLQPPIANPSGSRGPGSWYLRPV